MDIELKEKEEEKRKEEERRAKIARKNCKHNINKKILKFNNIYIYRYQRNRTSQKKSIYFFRKINFGR